MTDFFLKINSVVKQFDGHLAVKNASLNIPRAKIYGLLGPNGAGKTTIIRMITGIIAPDKGEIRFDNEPLSRLHSKRMGYMPEERGLYKKTKVIDQITYLLQLKGMKEKAAHQTAMSWLERLGLADWAQKLTTDLSKGMQQKVQFISTVAHEPDLLILDEPVSGLDPVNAKIMENEILRMKEKGTTIIFSTHRLEQVEELCDNLALIHRGEVLIENTITNVRKQFQKNQYRVEFVGEKSQLQHLEGVILSDVTENHAFLELKENQTGKNVMRQLTDLPLEILKFELHLPRLNDIFIELVGDPKELNKMIEN